MPSDSGEEEMTVTAVHGAPFTWFEYSGGIRPEISFSETPVLFGTASGQTGVKVGDDLYGIYFPSGASPTVNADGKMIFDEETAWVVVALLRSEDELKDFSRYATSVPRETRVSWKYDESSARVSTGWQVTAENLRGGASAPVLQGFLPHAYKYALPGPSLSFIDDKGFMTPRGIMKLAASDAGDFAYSYQFSGMLPAYAAPVEGEGFSRDVLDKLMSDYAAKGSFGGDTYWGGKGLVQMALNMSFARQSGNREVYLESRKRLREALVDWLTYTPGEDHTFFSYYPRWGAMLGFDVSYDSDAFNDHHFHYGYFTYAAALLCMEDKDFAAEYGGLLTMIAKDYANWDRDDARFPFMRTLDPWSGHSWAGGLGDHGNDNGNGQESTSEAMQSWGGIYLLGVALGNKEMRDAGLWGWNTEARATREYWYDVDAPRPANDGGRKAWPGKGEKQGNYKYDEYPYAYNSNITGKGIGWWTWFGGDPLFMHGIQWMPISPALDYLSWDKDFVGWAYDDMMRGANSTFSHSWFESTTNTADGSVIEPLAANDWGNVTLAYLQRYDPVKAAKIFDEALEKGMHIATAVSTAHISYFITHNHITYGDPDFDIHADIPTAQVSVRGDGTRTYTVYNPGTEDRTVNFYDRGGARVKSVTAPAGRLAAISADPVATEIELKLGNGNIIPPGASSAFTVRILDQYGAGMAGISPEVSLQAGAPASISGNTLKIDAGARRGTSFDLYVKSGELGKTLTITVNDPPTAASAVISGVPEICGRGMEFTPVLTVTDQYGALSEPEDTQWTLTASDGTSKPVKTPVRIDSAGKYRLTAVSASLNAETNADIFVSPALPLLSQGADVAASSAENVGSLPAGAVDGDRSVRWGSAHTDNEWIVVDLGENCYLSTVNIDWEAAYASRYELQLALDGVPTRQIEVNYAGQKRKVTVPVESAWTTIAEENASSAGDKTTALNATGRYLRMKGIERGSAYGYSCYEIEVFGLRESMGADAVIGVDFGLPVVLDRNETVTLRPRAFTRGGEVKENIAVEWSADKEADFSGNDFTPRSHGMYTVTALLPGVGSSSSNLFVNDVESPASVSLESESYSVVEGEDIRIPFTVMNQFLAPYTGDIGNLKVTVTDGNGNDAGNVDYDMDTMTFRSSLSAPSRTYKLDFGGLAGCTVTVKALSEMNLAIGKEATASGSNGGNKASLAVDGNPGTRWESPWEDSQTLTVDLGETYLIDRVNILWEGAYAKTYRLQTSVDGENWFDFYSRPESKGGEEKISFTPVASRYLRLACDVRALPAYGFSVKELEVYGVSRLADDGSPAPEIEDLTYDAGNGTLDATTLATHPSGTLFLTLSLENEAGESIQTSRCAIASGEAWNVRFSRLETGNYHLRLVASDAFGRQTGRNLMDIYVKYSIVGINLALGKDAWASSAENAALSASFAVDGDLATRWGSEFNDGEWITVDLGRPYLLTNVRLHWNTPAYATSYSVLGAAADNDADYELLDGRSEYSHIGEPENHIINSDRPYRYVKVVGHKRATGYGTSIDEMEVYGRDNGETTGAEGIAVFGESGEVWYTIQGIRLAGKPSEPGIYIRKCGSRSEKTIVR